MEEKSLLHKVKNGDIDAFNALYTLYAPLLYNKCLKLLKDYEIVNDLVQDTFLKIWHLRTEIDPEKGFRTFIFRIAENMVMDIFRRISRDKKLQEELWYNLVENSFHFNDHVIDKEKKMILEQAISQLSPRKKEIWILCKVNEKSYKEVAQQLGISVSSVSNQLVTAMKDIKDYIHKNYHNDYLMALTLLYLMKK
ncbi:RNA polymerase sigma factor [Sphingobacterium spiritivorum]|uniref:RNA polymerase sigma factor n=1 Tax=Sphingobacterium spiritivorum TaxID=258 RepID=UPI003DA6CD05